MITKTQRNLIIGVALLSIISALILFFISHQSIPLRNAITSIVGGEQENEDKEMSLIGVDIDVTDVDIEELNQILLSETDPNLRIAEGEYGKEYSPDGKYLAVTKVNSSNPMWTETVILDSNGTEIVKPQIGYLESWSPNSDFVLLYLASEETGLHREIYTLGINGDYGKFGLPLEATTAAISPVGGDIAYTLSKRGTNQTDLYVRDRAGEDKMVVMGEGSWIAFLSWSLQGDRVAFISGTDILSKGEQKLKILDINTGEVSEISAADWGYKPIWNKTGDFLIFKKMDDLWSYNINSKSLNHIQ